MKEPFAGNMDSESLEKKDLAVLDLYSGCGGMSTGLCLGAETAGVRLVTVSTFKEKTINGNISFSVEVGPVLIIAFLS